VRLGRGTELLGQSQIFVTMDAILPTLQGEAMQHFNNALIPFSDKSEKKDYRCGIWDKS
jgi:hypothetical protein